MVDLDSEALDSGRHPAWPTQPAVPQGAGDAARVLALLNDTGGENPNCPDCRGSVQRWGYTAGLQRYRCKACRRSFTPLTGTPLARLRRRDLWLGHAQILQEGASVRVAARRLGLHRNTAFRWRHRWLVNPRERKDTVFAGRVEVDTVAFYAIANGRCRWRRVAIRELSTVSPTEPRPSGDPAALVLVVRDRHGATTDAVLRRLDPLELAAVLGPVLDPERHVLCSTGAPSYRIFGARHGVLHRPILTTVPQQEVSAVLDRCRTALEHVRGYSRRLAHWMRRFRGVSTGYLANYLGWRRLLERGGDRSSPAVWLRIAAARSDQQPMVTNGSRGGTAVGEGSGSYRLEGTDQAIRWPSAVPRRWQKGQDWRQPAASPRESRKRCGRRARGAHHRPPTSRR